MSNDMKNFWPDLDENKCPCKNTGWALIEGKYTICSLHYCGALHPDEEALLLDMPEKLKEEQRKSIIRWNIKLAKERINNLESDLNKEKMFLYKYELELVNRTPTIQMRAVKVTGPEDIDGDGTPID